MKFALRCHWFIEYEVEQVSHQVIRLASVPQSANALVVVHLASIGSGSGIFWASVRVTFPSIVLRSSIDSSPYIELILQRGITGAVGHLLHVVSHELDVLLR